MTGVRQNVTVLRQQLGCSNTQQHIQKGDNYQSARQRYVARRDS